MSEIKLTPYQATVFRDVETLLKKRGNLQGVKVNPKAYWLSKQMAVYIMHNIGGTSTGVNNKVDVENVYQWLFGVLPPSVAPVVQVSNTGTATPPPASIIEFFGPFSTETAAFLYPLPAGAFVGGLFGGSSQNNPTPSLQTAVWNGDWLNTFWDSDNGFLIPFGFYKTISTTGPLLTNFSTDWPNHNNVFEVNTNGVRFNMAPQPPPTPTTYNIGLTVGHAFPGNPSDAKQFPLTNAAYAGHNVVTQYTYQNSLAVGTELNFTSGAGPGLNNQWYKIAQSDVSTDEGRILQLHKTWPDGPGIPTITVKDLW